MTDIYDTINDLYDRRRKVEMGGGEERIDKQHEKGKLTARERIELLVDPGTFIELNPFIKHRNTNFGMEKEEGPGEGVVTGYGKVNGRDIYLFSQDFTVFGGALGEMHALKIANVMDLAAENGAPFIGLNDSGGARIQEGVVSLDGYGQIFYRNSIYSGVIPQISVIMGPCAGGAVYSPAITDFVFMVEKTSQMFITGPKVIETVTGEKISSEGLGGATVHNTISGNAHFKGASEEQVLADVRRLLSYLPQNNEEKPPVLEADDGDDYRPDLTDVVPYEGIRPYDVRKVLKQVVDEDSFMEVQEGFAKNIVVGLARIKGKSVGLVCNQPKVLAGGLDIDSSDKAARFIRFCDSFNIPLITFEDVSGFFPGVKQEHGGIIRHGAKLLYAYSEATVPKLTIILRKAYGGAYVALNSKSIGADLTFAWPNAEIAVMGSAGAANIIFAREIQNSENPEATRAAKIEEYREKFANPYVAASLGMVDDVIDPRETRIKIIQSLDMLRNKKETRPWKKHGNIPL
ncbi:MULTISPECIES: acyl-CoA carboxylase subunit beta [Peribacillus]|uniref:Methylmalonyl-CoA carboxyltransferase n=1 Tax=Peribacillus simplex NBRC 15720 = DSM 1321 TaxID=1349754 RepID=A0A223EM34_9BACI|nr:carboxyl transferase domain-containing protein [Peribacillus simplex]ASS96293.1 methylmalonyl-CoA carboxyltransferase [Peribacillus simplex NBRC 15720 = DSM 1321]MEC1397415.1 carboxyl transferase domain-containing protein [Peribacillus simplex]MED3911182.1 carboxyl transferase domain-containing protein [Peribacillus simplex]MED3985448.1 carboxyl transferase domain-containing protein [Peribacillus simplex]MED4093803.1 carboxyl transferase domain-containing protein [Peribacillus simplex]